jgi:hypothetical protein
MKPIEKIFKQRFTFNFTKKINNLFNRIYLFFEFIKLNGNLNFMNFFNIEDKKC